jgi:hypothetical protein
LRTDLRPPLRCRDDTAPGREPEAPSTDSAASLRYSDSETGADSSWAEGVGGGGLSSSSSSTTWGSRNLTTGDESRGMQSEAGRCRSMGAEESLGRVRLPAARCLGGGKADLSRGDGRAAGGGRDEYSWPWRLAPECKNMIAWTTRRRPDGERLRGQRDVDSFSPHSARRPQQRMSDEMRGKKGRGC